MSDLLFSDGKLHINSDLVAKEGSELLTSEASEYLWVVTDKDDKILFGIQSNGNIVGNFPSITLSDDENEYIKDSLRMFPNSKYLPMLQSLNRTVVATGDFDVNSKYYPRKDYKIFNLLTLADIHGDAKRTANFVEFAKQFDEYLNDSIILGDITQNQWNNYVDFNDIEGYDNVLKVIGNHDVYYYFCTFTVNGITNVPSAGDTYYFMAGSTKYTYEVVETNISNGSGTIKCIQYFYRTSRTTGTLLKIDGTGDSEITFTDYLCPTGAGGDAPIEKVFERYMQNIENWGVEYTTNKCYYYKDYTDEKIRLIVLDDYDISTEQTNWLTNILMGENNENSALALGLHVIIAAHQLVVTVSKRTLWECPFTNYDDKFATHDTYAYLAVPGIVDQFQQAGGIFVTYIFGHYHIDMIGECKDYPNQIFIVYPIGNQTSHIASDTLKTDTGEMQNQFTVTSVDTKTKTIRLLRIGATYNRYLMKRESIAISYEDDNRKIVSYEYNH